MENKETAKEGKEQTAPVVETPVAEEQVELVEAEFDAPEAQAEVTPPPAKRDYTKYKQLFEADDIDDDEKLDARLETIVKENKSLRTIAAGRGKIENDPDIKGWNGLLKKSEEDLFVIGETQRYLNAGIPQQEAEAKAQVRLEDLKKREGHQQTLEDYALDIRAKVRGAIDERAQEIAGELENAEKSLDLRSFDKKVLEKAKEQVSKTDSFIGFKIPEKDRASVQKDVLDYMEGDLAKDLKDPEALAEFAFFRRHKKQWERNVLSRTNGKKTVIDKLKQEPGVTNNKKVVLPQAKQSAQKATGKGLMPTPSAFLGE